MAFTKTPEQSTHITHRFPLVTSPDSRDGTGTKDAKLMNMFPEAIKTPLTGTLSPKKFNVKERPGLVPYLTQATTGEGRGIAFFNGGTWTVVGGNLLHNGTVVQALSTSTGQIGFTDYSGVYKALVLLDGISGWVVKTDNTITQITSLDFPTPHVPFPIACDGYLVVAKADTDDIYNSDFEDPLGWTPGNFITAEMYPDTIQALSYNNNYILAIGTNSVEFFYDAGIATGSPFQRNETGVQQFGCLAPRTVVNTEKETIFLGNTLNGGYTGWLLDGFKPTEFTIEPIKQTLDREGSDLRFAKACVFRTMGHKFYMLNLTTRTLVFDFEENLWHEWTYSNLFTSFCCDFITGLDDGRVYLIHRTNGTILYLDPTVATDTITMGGSATPIPVEIVTERLDFDTINRKTCSRLSLTGDTPSNGSVNISVQWSDDDYVTYSTARTLVLNRIRPMITQLGQFRQRSFRFTYSDVYPLRLMEFEIDINMGQQ